MNVHQMAFRQRTFHLVVLSENDNVMDETVMDETGLYLDDIKTLGAFDW